MGRTTDLSKAPDGIENVLNNERLSTEIRRFRAIYLLCIFQFYQTTDGERNGVHPSDEGVSRNKV